MPEALPCVSSVSVTVQPTASPEQGGTLVFAPDSPMFATWAELPEGEYVHASGAKIEIVKL